MKLAASFSNASHSNNFFYKFIGSFDLGHGLLQIISGCAKTREGYAKAKSFVEDIKNSNLVQDAVIYGAIMNVCAAHGLEKEAQATFKEMCDAGFTPNLFHYSSLLNTYASKGKYEQAEGVLQEIRAAGLTPNLVPPFSHVCTSGCLQSEFKSQFISISMV